MSAWSLLEEEANIVLIGGFNPRIFHPEWLIRKGIAEPWDYENDNDLLQVRELARVSLPDEKLITVTLDRFIIRTPLASEYSAIKDVAVGIFSVLSETPFHQLGMNYQASIQLDSRANWKKFGSNLAPKNYWLDAADYIGSEDIKEEDAGLWDLTMHLPRPDNYKGHIHPRICVKNTPDKILHFSVNSHIELDEESDVTEILNSSWEKSLKLSSTLMENIMKNQLE